MTTFINKTDGSVVKQIPLDKERMFALEELLGDLIMKEDNIEIRTRLQYQTLLIRELSNLPKGTLLELI